MRENEGKCKKEGVVESLAPKRFINDQDRSLLHSDAWDLYTAQSQAKLQKSVNWPLLHEGQLRKGLRNFTTLVKLSGCYDSMLLFFQFLICNYVLNLDSPWLS